MQQVTGIPNNAADMMRQQLYSLQLKEQELLSVFKDDARQVREIRRQIQEAAGYSRQGRIGTVPVDQWRRSHLPAVAPHLEQQANSGFESPRRMAKTGEQMNDAQTSLAHLNDVELQITQLKRDLELQERSYRKYSENLEQARIDQALKLERISNISVAQGATHSPKRTGRRKSCSGALVSWRDCWPACRWHWPPSTSIGR